MLKYIAYIVNIGMALTFLAIAFEEGASKDGFYRVLDGIIKTGSKIAIKISEKY